jgi:hypothetical protein
MPDLKLDSGWGFLYYPPDIHSGAYTQILGTRYAFSDLNATYQRVIHGEHWQDNEERLLMDLLRRNPADRRMWYRAYLDQAIRNATPEDLPWLEVERINWTRRDLDEMVDRLWDGLEHHDLRLHMNEPDEHWMWQKPPERGRLYPTLPSWRMMKHITVHRLLWPIMWPDSPFTSRPVRLDARCLHTQCVNPRHFIDSSKRTRARNMGPGRGFKREQHGGNSIPYYPEHAIPQGDGTFTVVCPLDPTHDAPDKYSIMAEDLARLGRLGSFRGKMYCPICVKRFEAYKAGSERHGITRTPSALRQETEIERFERMGRELQAPNDGYPEWSYPDRQVQAEQEALPEESKVTPGWPAGYDVDEATRNLRKEGKL